MHGVAVTRVSSADGARIYTLYDRGGGRMFVHALNTVAGTARCIDLPRHHGTQAVTLKLWGDGSRLDVASAGTPRYRINTTTFGIDPVQPPKPPPAAPRPAPAHAGGNAWPAVLLGLVAILAAVGAVILLVRRREATLRVWRPRSG
jgi:hypothetical protein